MIDRISEPLVIVRHTTDGDVRTNVQGNVQARKAFFRLDVDIEEGDLIEQPVDTGKIKTYRATRVTHNKHRTLGHIAVEIDPVTTKAAAAPRRVEIGNLHPTISTASGALYTDQHYSRAVFAAFQAVERRIQQMSGSEESGVKLMHQVFDPNKVKIDVARHDGPNARDERDGFRFLLVGAVLALRNPRGHGDDLPDGPDEALEYLALASVIMRRLDAAQVL